MCVGNVQLPTVNKDAKVETVNVGDVCALEAENWADHWPQIAERETVTDDDITVIWYKGGRTTQLTRWQLFKNKMSIYVLDRKR